MEEALTIHKLLDEVIKLNASDLHIQVGDAADDTQPKRW